MDRWAPLPASSVPRSTCARSSRIGGEPMRRRRRTLPRRVRDLVTPMRQRLTNRTARIRRQFGPRVPRWAGPRRIAHLRDRPEIALR